MNSRERYKNIIDLPHYTLKNHKPMLSDARAAQFAPFDALTGYGDEIKETARITINKVEIDENEKEILDKKLQIISKNLDKQITVSITYFVADSKKSGGKYEDKTGAVRKINEYTSMIIMEDNTEIPILDIIDISIDNYKK